MKWLLFLGLFILPSYLCANENVYQGPLVNESGLTYGATYTLNLTSKHIDLLSAQVNFSTTSFSSVSFNDGTTSTTSLTMSKWAQFTQTSATNTITINSNTSAAITGQTITLNGTALTEGVKWGRASTSSGTITSLVAALNTVSGFSASVVLTGGTTVALVTSGTPGTFGNQYTLTSSTPAALTVGSSTFQNGRDNLIVYINSVPLKQGTDWSAVTNASTTAKNLSDAIQGNSYLASIIRSTWSAAGVVTATSTSVGSFTNYSIYSSSPALLTPAFASSMTGGTASDISTATVSISKSNNFTTGAAVLFGATGTTPKGLIDKTTYFVTATPTATSFKLSTTKLNAIAGTAIDISTQVVTGGDSFTLTPLAYSINGSNMPTVLWQVSNDGSSWANYGSSITYTITTATTSVVNFGLIGFNWFRALLTYPFTGAVNVSIPMRGDEQR